jgi:hypothetical protein
MKCHGKQHILAVIHILGYLKKNPNWGVGFSKNHSGPKPIKISLASDSSWADVIPERISSYGYISMFNGNGFHAASRKTPMIAVHVPEAEYYAFAELCRDAKFIFYFLQECKLDFETPFAGKIDNQAAQRLLGSWKVSQRTKHMDTKCQYSRMVCITEKIVKPEWVATGDNIADITTKALGRTKHSKFRGMILIMVPNCTN